MTQLESSIVQYMVRAVSQIADIRKGPSHLPCQGVAYALQSLEICPNVDIVRHRLWEIPTAAITFLYMM